MPLSQGTHATEFAHNEGVDATTVGSESVYVLMRDKDDDILIAYGTTVPTNSTDGYAKGCLFIDTDVATGTGGLYSNKGTKDSCVFSLVTQA